LRTFISNIKEKAKKDKKTIVYPESDDQRILRAACQVCQEGIADIILVGEEQKIREQAQENNLDLDGIMIINPLQHEKFEEYAQAFYELRKHKGITPEKAKQILEDPVYYAVMLVHMGDADGMISGASHTTAETVRPALQIIKTHGKFHKVSSFFFMMLESKLLLFADCAIIIAPDAKDLSEIAMDTARSAQKFGIEPRVAMLSFSTKGSAKHPFVDKVREATSIVRDRMPDLVVDGEMQVDAALVPEVCSKKCKDCALQGNANVFIFPDLQSGNIAYKLVERLAKANAVGPVLQGLKKPVNDLSRGCSVQDIIDLTAITAVEAQKA